MKKLFFGITAEASAKDEFSLLFLRVATGLIMALTHGLGKVPPPDMLVQKIGEMGFPMPGFFTWAAALSEFAGGMLLALGLLTRPAALFLGFTMLVAVVGVHWADPFATKELGILYFSICLLFALRGSGRWSIDYLINKKS